MLPYDEFLDQRRRLMAKVIHEGYKRLTDPNYVPDLTRPEDLATWDLHATATPGDYREIETLRGVVPDSVLVTARKGTFGHGMSAGGGWELTAQYLGYEKGRLYPTPLHPDELNREIGRIHDVYVFDEPCQATKGVAGKLSMGIVGINACVLSRPWEEE